MSTPELEDVLLEAMDDRLLDVHTAVPGKVLRYDVATQTADVQPLVRAGGVALPVLPNCPVAFPRGGGFFLSFPLQVGDFVFVVFPENSIDLWRARSGAEGDPGDQRRHSPTSGVALPCLYPSARALSDAHGANLVLGKDGGTQVHIKSGQVSIGSENASDFVALAAKVATELAKLNADLNTLKSGVLAALSVVAPPGPTAGLVVGAGAATAFSSATSTVPTAHASVAATVTKAD
jgi:hypothetical protein